MFTASLIISDFFKFYAVRQSLKVPATKRLRLDFEFETVASQKDCSGMRETGVGDVSLGFKTIARDKPKERLTVAFSYSVKLPTADEKTGLGIGKVDHNLRLNAQLLTSSRLSRTEFASFSASLKDLIASRYFA